MMKTAQPDGNGFGPAKVGGKVGGGTTNLIGGGTSNRIGSGSGD